MYLLEITRLNSLNTLNSIKPIGSTNKTLQCRKLLIAQTNKNHEILTYCYGKLNSFIYRAVVFEYPPVKKIFYQTYERGKTRTGKKTYFIGWWRI